MKGVNLSVNIKGVTFRNPIIPGSSDIVLTDYNVRNCIEHGIGGIVTKSFCNGALRTRPRPCHFSYGILGRDLENSWMSRGSFHVMEPVRAAEELVPKWSRWCKDAGIPLVVSIADTENVDGWVADAKRFEDAGADMLELNFSCPHAAEEAGELLGKAIGYNLELTMTIVRAIKGVVRIPVGPKLSISFDPYDHFIKGWEEAAADFIVCHNTPAGMLIDVEHEVPFGGLGAGGYLMGRAFLPWSLARVVATRKLTDLPIVATGGVWQATDAIMYLLIGCPLVEVTSSIFKNGYGHYAKIVAGIENWMEYKGYSSIEDFRGKAFGLARMHSSLDLIPMEWPFPMPQERSSPIIPIVDMDKCIICGKCEDFCLSGVFTVTKEKGTVNIDHEHRCWGCGECVGWCPSNAISLIDRNTQEVVWDNHGLAKPYRPAHWKKSEDLM